MKARSSQRLLSNADQLDTPTVKRMTSVEEYQDSPRKERAGQEERTPGSQRKFNGGEFWRAFTLRMPKVFVQDF
ncbi:hypothetical protein V5799_007664 [Amblyomma americanum]|uniref:Uncharacterized protein n=1 Tax=Amblyomma americanum TaxID=6943 RepID=A0AAQ4FGY9_AMBAM